MRTDFKRALALDPKLRDDIENNIRIIKSLKH
jgi:hypothetical protein